MKPFQLGLRPLFFFFCVFTVLLSVDFVSAQGLLITEFQAFNESTIQDEDNEYTDWIEIFNSGEDAVNLNGYYLTDSVEELSKWQFPAVTLQPGRFLVVFASGKDRRNPASELHTNFSIERNGGEQLKTEALTGAGWHHHEGMMAFHDVRDDLPLQGVELTDREAALEYLVEFFRHYFFCPWKPQMKATGWFCCNRLVLKRSKNTNYVSKCSFSLVDEITRSSIEWVGIIMV